MKHLPEYSLLLIPLLGWAYIGIGWFFQFESRLLYYAWIITILLCCGSHLLQLAITIPMAKQHDIRLSETLFMTLVFGAAWWKPLKNSLKRNSMSRKEERLKPEALL